MVRNKTKTKKERIGFLIALLLDFVFLVLIIRFLGAHWHFAQLNPKGVIAAGEKKVMVTAVLLMLIVVVPVLAATFIIARKYRADNKASAAAYRPEWDDPKFEFLWWAFPGAIIIALGVLTWQSSHALDPYKPINSNVKPITVQVVALPWKWLFIYPEQNIATVNFVEFPENTPVDFELTADAPMSSFWIPQLGSQIYAMAGMSTQLHLMANQIGEFNGLEAEINGRGYSGMKFLAKSVSSSDFEQWVAAVHQSSLGNLSMDTYNKLVQPSTDNPEAFYAPVQENLYNSIIQKFMGPSNASMPGMDMPGMDMNGMMPGMDMNGMQGMNMNGK